MRVRLRIESIAIEGLDLQPHQLPALHAALTAELAALFANCDGLRDRVTLGLTARMQEAADSRPAQLARQIGRAVHGSVTRHAQ